MSRWTLCSLKHVPMPTTLRVEATTNKDAHMWMTWSYHRPAREIIYRTVRGKMIRCGYKYLWYEPRLVEQIQEGDTMGHIFLHTRLIPGSRIFYYLHSPVEGSIWECQGPLQMVYLLEVGAPGTYLYFASRAKGMFMTTTFSPIDGPDPVWIPDNEGFLTLDIRHAVLDPFIPAHRRYAIAGGHLYRHFNDADFGPANAVTILTNPEALALTGSPAGEICWVHPNRRHPGMLHVLWISQPGSNGFWHIRTLDYGQHWTAHQIDPHLSTYNAGNIQAGFDRASSPYGEGDVLYACINFDFAAKPHVARSLDQGITWETFDTPDIARGEFRPKLYVEPSNQAVVYLGSHPYGGGLYRSEDHAESWENVRNAWPFDVNLEHPLSHAVIRTHYSNPNLVRVLRHPHVYRSQDYCASWQELGLTSLDIREFTFTDDNPNLLYLAKIREYVGGPPELEYHTIFVTEDEGVTLYPKSGAHPDLEDGHGDSIPISAGGAADDGILVVTKT